MKRNDFAWEVLGLIYRDEFRYLQRDRFQSLVNLLFISLLLIFYK